METRLFDPVKVVDRLPFRITALASWGPWVLLGSSSGALVIFDVDHGPSGLTVKVVLNSSALVSGSIQSLQLLSTPQSHIHHSSSRPTVPVPGAPRVTPPSALLLVLSNGQITCWHLSGDPGAPSGVRLESLGPVGKTKGTVIAFTTAQLPSSGRASPALSKVMAAAGALPGALPGLAIAYKSRDIVLLRWRRSPESAASSRTTSSSTTPVVSPSGSPRSSTVSPASSQGSEGVMAGGRWVLWKELVAPDGVVSLAWTGAGILLGFARGAYSVITLPSGVTSELFASPKAPARIVRLEGTETALAKDSFTVFFDAVTGRPARSYGLAWPAPPTTIAYASPWLLGAAPTGVSVRLPGPARPGMPSINLPGVHLIEAASPRVVYAASPSALYRLVPAATGSAVAALLADKRPGAALSVAIGAVREGESDGQSALEVALRGAAVSAFQAQTFDVALAAYAAISDSPRTVLALWPDLLPFQIRAKARKAHVNPPTAPPGEGPVRKAADLALLGYLTSVRTAREASGSSGSDASTAMAAAAAVTMDRGGELSLMDLVNAAASLVDRSEWEHLDAEERREVDTTIVRLCLAVNTSLLGPFLRRPNDADRDIVEALLLDKRRYSELVGLYRTRGLHRAALELLSRASSSGSGADSSLAGLKPTIRYLRTMPASARADLMEFAATVIAQSPTDGLTIFTGEPGLELQNSSPSTDASGAALFGDAVSPDTPADVPTADVLAFLKEKAPTLAAPYVTWVIGRADASNARVPGELYTEHALLLLDRAIALSSKAEGTSGVLLKSTRTELQKLLNNPDAGWDPDPVLAALPSKGLTEERAAVYARLGHHEQAIALYVHSLKDVKAAEEYCARVWRPGDRSTRDVYYLLLRGVLGLSTTRHSGLPSPSSAKSAPPLTEAQVEEALAFMARHAHQIGVDQALELLPVSTTVASARGYLMGVMRRAAESSRTASVLASLHKAEADSVRREWAKTRNGFFRVDDDTVCPACHKRLGLSVPVRYPSGLVLHLSCGKGVLPGSPEEQKLSALAHGDDAVRGYGIG